MNIGGILHSVGDIIRMGEKEVNEDKSVLF